MMSQRLIAAESSKIHFPQNLLEERKSILEEYKTQDPLIHLFKSQDLFCIFQDQSTLLLRAHKDGLELMSHFQFVLPNQDFYV